MGGAGHVVPPPKATQGALGILMPLYTIGIVMIFVYTMMKVCVLKIQYKVFGNDISAIASDSYLFCSSSF